MTSGPTADASSYPAGTCDLHPHELPPGTANSSPPVIYGVDAEDTIVGASRSWDQFATANEAANVRFASVKGRKLWDFITDPTTKDIYTDVVANVRAGATITLPLRCDSPTARRWLTLTATPMAGGGVKFTSRTIREQSRPRVAILDMRSPRSSQFIKACSWCRKFQVPSQGWAEVEEAVMKLGLFDSPSPPLLTHGICPACAGILLKLESDDLQAKITSMS